MDADLRRLRLPDLRRPRQNFGRRKCFEEINDDLRDELETARASEAPVRGPSAAASNTPSLTPVIIDHAMLNAIWVSSNGVGATFNFRIKRSIRFSATIPRRICHILSFPRQNSL